MPAAQEDGVLGTSPAAMNADEFEVDQLDKVLWLLERFERLGYGYERSGASPSWSPGFLGARQAGTAWLRGFAVIALALLIRPSRLWWAAALIVAASAFGAVVLYRYVDVGRLGPLPNMFEPTWALPGKAASAWAEGAGIILATAGLLTTRRVRAPRPVPVDGRRQP
jgi:hypothetical protein